MRVEQAQGPGCFLAMEKEAAWFPTAKALNSNHRKGLTAAPVGLARLSNRFQELLLPVDLIAGTADKIVSTAGQGRRLHMALHNSFFDKVPGAGHMVHHAHPER